MMKSHNTGPNVKAKNDDFFEEIIIEKGPTGYHFVKRKKK